MTQWNAALKTKVLRKITFRGSRTLSINFFFSFSFYKKKNLFCKTEKYTISLPEQFCLHLINDL